MKRFFGIFLALFLVIVVFTQPANASTSDFTISYFHADYYLKKDNEGRSDLTTVETITAIFPESNQNHGLERYLVGDYDNHSTSPSLVSVTDKNGNDLKYKRSRKFDDLTLNIGDANTYVHGFQTYVITYTQRDVTKFFSNTNDDEFYWDINGTGWKQPFFAVTATLHLDSSIINDLNGNLSCYFGVYGSDKKCKIFLDGDVISAMVMNLNSNENMTIAVGFKPHTFAEYKKTQLDIIKEVSSVFLISASLLCLGIISYLRIVKVKSAPGRGIIVPEYLPPKGIDVAIAAMIIKKPKKWLAATFIDLAVRQNIRIIEQKNNGIFKKSKYNLEFLSAKGLSDNESSVIEAIFGDNPEVGSIYKLERRRLNRVIIKKMGGRYFKSVKDVTGKMDILQFCIFIFSIISLYCFEIFGYSYIPVVLVGFLSSILCVIIGDSTRAFSDSGRVISDHLKGLKLYLKIVEEDRIKILQSPQGASKTPVDIEDGKYLVHLYERVLPYAILFGNEKKWLKVIGKYYDPQANSPGWYGGDNLNTALFYSSVHSFTRSTTGGIGSSASSGIFSSSGGSGGGGFSGGGGGGGGGGGW